MKDDVKSDPEVAEGTEERTTWKRVVFVWILPAIVVAVAIWLYGSSGRFVSTDDAYLQQDRVDVAPQVSGNVVKVLVAENARVTAGQPLIQLDDSYFKTAEIAARNRWMAARTEVRMAKSAIREKRGEVKVARAAAEFAQRELARQSELADRKLVSAASLDTARRAVALSDGTVDVLELQVDQALAKLAYLPDLELDDYPPVRAAFAELERARIDLERTLIVAPQPGIVSHLPKVGARVDVGRAACAIVVDQHLWIEANYKETDLEWVRPGAPAEVVIDTYPNHSWKGRVESIAQATGSVFSLLPPQNASGNWVKVVQRIPVRIAVERRPDDPPLRNGMSANVEIDTGPHTRFDRWFGRSKR